MTIDIKPETKELVQDEIRRGHFCSVDEIIEEGVKAWREKHGIESKEAGCTRRIYDLLSRPPFAGSELEIERQKDNPRNVDLG